MDSLYGYIYSYLYAVGVSEKKGLCSLLERDSSPKASFLGRPVGKWMGTSLMPPRHEAGRLSSTSTVVCTQHEG